MGRSISGYIRQHHVGLIAAFIALTGTAYASNQVAATHEPTADTAKAKIKRGPPGPPGPQGIQGIPGQVGPSTGPAGGDLTGSYPNPAIGSGKVTADKFAVLPAARATMPADPNNSLSCPTHQTIPTGTDTAVVYSGEDFDTAGLHETTPCVPAAQTIASLLTAPRAGIYQVDAGVKWGDENNTVGERFLGVLVNSGTNPVVPVGSRIPALGDAVGGTEQAVSTMVSLNAGEYVQAIVYQNSGSDISLLRNQDRNFLEMHWVGPAS